MKTLHNILEGILDVGDLGQSIDSCAIQQLIDPKMGKFVSYEDGCLTLKKIHDFELGWRKIQELQEYGVETLCLKSGQVYSSNIYSGNVLSVNIIDTTDRHCPLQIHAAQTVQSDISSNTSIDFVNGRHGISFKNSKITSSIAIGFKIPGPINFDNGTVIDSPTIRFTYTSTDSAHNPIYQIMKKCDMIASFASCTLRPRAQWADEFPKGFNPVKAMGINKHRVGCVVLTCKTGREYNTIKFVYDPQNKYKWYTIEGSNWKFSRV